VKGGLRMLRVGNRYFAETLRAQFAGLPDATAGADLIVGAGLQMAAPSVAERHGVPYRYVAYAPLVFPSADYPPFMLPLPELPRWVNRLLWALAVSGYELGPALPPKLEAFLANGPPPVYLGFGSMTDTDPAATTRVLVEAVERAGCRALVSEGWAGLGWTPLPEGVLSIGSVSHARLFPRTAAVVHHGGAGTTATAARAGVPQIVVPHVFDQIYWGRRVAALGLGPPAIPRTQLTAERLADAIREALENEVIRERASQLGAAILARVAADGDPARHFELA
jgi:vancomycin aglycone glucosyltransferase